MIIGAKITSVIFIPKKMSGTICNNNKNQSKEHIEPSQVSKHSSSTFKSQKFHVNTETTSFEDTDSMKALGIILAIPITIFILVIAIVLMTLLSYCLFLLMEILKDIVFSLFRPPIGTFKLLAIIFLFSSIIYLANLALKEDQEED